MGKSQRYASVYSVGMSDFANSDTNRYQYASFDEIKQLILSSPKSTCLSDPVPSNLLPHCNDSIVPIVTRIVNLFINSSTFPNEFRSAFFKPVLKNQIWIQ